jgi:hypothetical protein
VYRVQGLPVGRQVQSFGFKNYKICGVDYNLVKRSPLILSKSLMLFVTSEQLFTRQVAAIIASGSFMF